MAKAAEEVAVDEDGMRVLRAGVENVETNEPRERSGWVKADWFEVSPLFAREMDMAILRPTSSALEGSCKRVYDTTVSRIINYPTSTEICKNQKAMLWTK